MPDRIDSFIDLVAIEAEKTKLIAALREISAEMGNIPKQATGMKDVVTSLNQIDTATKKLQKTAKELTDAQLLEAEQRKKVNAERRKEAAAIASGNLEWYKHNKALREAGDAYRNLAIQQNANVKEVERLKKAYDDLRDKTDRVNESMRNHQGNVGNYKSALSGIKDSLANVAAGMLAAFSFGAISAFFVSSFRAYEESIKQERKLLAALNGRKDMQQDLINQAGALQASLGVDDEAIMSIQALAAEHDLTTEQIKKVTRASIELAAVTGMDLNSAASQLLGTLEGIKGKTLPKLSEEFGNLTTEQLKNGDAIDLVIQKYSGMQAASVTAAQRSAIAWDEFKERFGKATAPVAEFFLKLGSGLLSIGDDAKKAAELQEIGLVRLFTRRNVFEKQISQLRVQGNKSAADDLQKNVLDPIEKEIARRKEVANLDSKERAAAKYRIQDAKEETKVKEQKVKVEKEDVELAKWRLAIIENMTTASKESIETTKKLTAEEKAFWDEAARFQDIKLPWENDLNDQIKFINKTNEVRDVLSKLSDDLIQLGFDTAGTIFQNFNADNLNTELGKIQDELTSWHETQLQQLEEKKNAGIISDKEYQAAKIRLDKEYEAKQKAAKNREAQLKKEAALYEIAINTAVAVAKTLAEYGFTPAGYAAAALAAAQGLEQAAIVTAQPILKYKTGTDNHPGGMAVIGDDGREAVILPSGETFVTPDRATLAHLPVGTKVIPNINTFGGLQPMNQSTTLRAEGSGKEFMELKEVIKGLPITTLNITENGIYAATKRGNNIEVHLNTNVRL